MSWKSPVCASEPTVAQQWLWCQPSPLCPAEVVGQQGPLPTPAQGKAQRVRDLLYALAALRSSGATLKRWWQKAEQSRNDVEEG